MHYRWTRKSTQKRVLLWSSRSGIVIEAKDNLDYENVIRNVKEKVVKVAFDYEN